MTPPLNDPSSSTEEEPQPAQAAPVYKAALSAITCWLAARRRLLCVLYIVFMAAWIGLILYSSVAIALPDFVNGAHLEGSAVSDLRQDEDWGIKGCVIGGFCLLQALFVFGGGRLTVRPGRVPWYKRLASLLVFASLMLALSTGLVLAFLQMTARMGDATRDADEDRITQFIDEHLSSAGDVWLACAAVWIVWLGIGLLSVRGTSHTSGLSRLVGQLLIGSWVEFAVALPIDLATRSREKSCPCASGSWLALLICLPVLIWSVGPALALLFWREKNLNAADQGHSRRVVRGKSSLDVSSKSPAS